MGYIIFGDENPSFTIIPASSAITASCIHETNSMKFNISTTTTITAGSYKVKSNNEYSTAPLDIEYEFTDTANQKKKVIVKNVFSGLTRKYIESTNKSVVVPFKNVKSVKCRFLIHNTNIPIDYKYKLEIPFATLQFESS